MDSRGLLLTVFYLRFIITSACRFNIREKPHAVRIISGHEFQATLTISTDYINAL